MTSILPPETPGVPVVQESDFAYSYREMEGSFDARWYVDHYLGAEHDVRFRDDPFTHYLVDGIPAGFSPNADFDEEFYRAFYSDILSAISRGDIPCGFYHYVIAGRREDRLPKYDRKAVLEARIPNVTRPALMERIPGIKARMRLPRVRVNLNAPARVWVMLPTINPDITFGGYRSVLELMRRLCQLGHKVTVLCTEDGQANKTYFSWREESAAMRLLMRDVDVAALTEDYDLVVGPHDTIVVYSLWDLYAADRIRELVPEIHIVLLIQEYEPIFYDHCSARAIAEAAYSIRHYALINSSFLCRFLQSHRVGVFNNAEAMPDRDYRVFEHRINQLTPQTAEQMVSRSERVLIAYARPESHAARNMFELLVLALQVVCAEGLFSSDWQFIGLGSLIDTNPVELGSGHRLVMHAKMTEERYTTYISMMDIGISLMYAPHPSVMPFEFATTGALVVTNTYENRSAAELSAISGNIIGGCPSIEGIAAALREAVARVPDAVGRVANIYRPVTTSWADIFDDDLVHTVFDRPIVEPKRLNGSVPVESARVPQRSFLQKGRRAGDQAGNRPAATVAPDVARLRGQRQNA